MKTKSRQFFRGNSYFLNQFSIATAFALLASLCFESALFAQTTPQTTPLVPATVDEINDIDPSRWPYPVAREKLVDYLTLRSIEITEEKDGQSVQISKSLLQCPPDCPGTKKRKQTTPIGTPPSMGGGGNGNGTPPQQTDPTDPYDQPVTDPQDPLNPPQDPEDPYDPYDPYNPYPDPYDPYYPGGGYGNDTVSKLERVVMLGTRMWTFIQQNKAITDHKYHRAHALPEGSKHWTQFEQWNAPVARTFSVRYTNLMNIDVARFKYRLMYTPGGTFDGKGKYIANVSVIPTGDTHATWAFKLEASTEIGDVLNVGTRAQPIAGMEVHVKWKVSSNFSVHEDSHSFFIQGDAKFKDYNGND